VCVQFCGIIPEIPATIDSTSRTDVLRVIDRGRVGCNFAVIFLLTTVNSISLQCSDTVGWATGRSSGLYKVGVGLLVMMI